MQSDASVKMHNVSCQNSCHHYTTHIDNIEKRKSGPFGIELIIWLQNKINGKLDR